MRMASLSTRARRESRHLPTNVGQALIKESRSALNDSPEADRADLLRLERLRRRAPQHLGVVFFILDDIQSQTP